MKDMDFENIKREQDSEPRRTVYDEWRSNNLRNLRIEFCEDREDEFEEYCRHKFDSEGIRNGRI